MKDISDRALRSVCWTVVGICIGSCESTWMERNKQHKEAVKAGVGYWEDIPNGKEEFHYGTKPEAGK